MVTNPIIKKAVYFSAEKHDGQYRKGSRVPYFAHAVLVALGVFKYSTDEHLIAAAVLHDVLEDCHEVTIKELKKLFGDRVVRLIREVSFLKNKHDKNLFWKEKKLLYIKKIRDVSKEALLIVAVDKMSNMQAYFEAIKSGRKDLNKFFGGTMDDYFWYYQEIYIILKYRLKGHMVVKEYRNILEHYEKNLLK